MAELPVSSRMSRRTFLAGATVLPALLLTAAGPAPAAPQKVSAAGPSNRKAIVQVLDAATATGDMSGAIGKYGASLTPGERKILLGLTPSELAALHSMRSKLRSKTSP